MTLRKLMFVLLLVGGCAAPTTAMVECPPSGCAPLEVNPLEASLRDHASFDLQCAAPQLGVRWLDDTTAEVRGCGKGARYAYVVTRFQSRWVLDSPVLAGK